MRRISLLFVTSLLLSCGGSTERTTEEKPETKVVEPSFELLINPALVNTFYDHEIINLSNPDITSILVDKIIFDLDHDNRTDTVKLFRIQELENDPGDFHRIQINMGNGQTLDEINIDGWIRNNNYQPKQNEIESNFISIVKNEQLTLLMCFGWYYASDPPQLTIFEFTTGKPRIAFHQNFAIRDLTLNADAILNGEKFYQEDESSETELFYLKLVNNSLELKANEIRDRVNLGVSVDSNCSSETCLYISEKFEELTREDILTFLSTFHPDCNNNAEFSEWSNGLLFRILSAYPETTVELLESNELERQNIISTLESPINDAILIQPLIDKINRLENLETQEVLTALETAMSIYSVTPELANSEWRFYYDSENYDYLKFGKTHEVQSFSADTEELFYGTYQLQDSKIIVLLTYSESERWNELDKMKYRNWKYELELKNGEIQYLTLWQLNNQTGNYEVTKSNFDPDYLLTKQ